MDEPQTGAIPQWNAFRRNGDNQAMGADTWRHRMATGNNGSSGSIVSTRTIENDKLVKLGMRPLKVRQWPTAKTNYMRGTYPYASPLYTFLSQADTASGRASEHPTARTLISD